MAYVDVSGCILSIYEPKQELAVFKACVHERREHFVVSPLLSTALKNSQNI